jgi:hypothetical protein
MFLGLVVEGERNTGQRFSHRCHCVLILEEAGHRIVVHPGFIDMTVVDLSGRQLLHFPKRRK